MPNADPLIKSIPFTLSLPPGISPQGRWHEVAPMGLFRSSSGLCALDGRLWAAGGFADGSGGAPTLDAAEVFCPVAGRWEPVPPMTHARSGLALVGL